jgi:hypothetical protein
MDTRTHFRFHLWIAVLAFCYSSPLPTNAQDGNPLELLRQFPATLESLQAANIEAAKRMLEWKIEIDKNTSRTMEQMIAALEDEIEQRQEVIAHMAHEEMGDYEFTSDTFRSQLTEQVLKRLLDVRQEIAANEALANHVDKSSHQASSNQAETKNRELARFRTQRAAVEAKLARARAENQRLQAQHDLARAENERLQTQHDLGVIRGSELAESKVAIQNLQAEITELDLRDAYIRQQPAKAHFCQSCTLTKNQANVQLSENRAREFESMARLRELALASSCAMKIRQAQRKIDQLNAALDARVRRRLEAEMDAEESRALLEVIEKMLTEGEEGVSTPNAAQAPTLTEDP